MQSSEEVQIDTNLYSRQIGTFGLETMGKLIKLKVLIVGMRGLGVECAKNLILAGPASVDIYDPTTVTLQDMGSNFYIRDSHIGQVSRAAASVTQLSQLNPYVKVSVIESLSVEDHKNYSCVCYTENLNGHANLIEVNQFCHDFKVGFVLSECLGVFGYAFVDYGDKHFVSDADGIATKPFIVSEISNEQQATVTVDDSKRYSYQVGDYVQFVEVEGMTEINNLEPVKIVKASQPFAFQIDLDTTNFGKYTRQGIVENKKVPLPISFHTLSRSYLNPGASSSDGWLMPADDRFIDRSSQLHIALRTLHAFHSEHKRYPDLGDGDALSALSKTINAEAKSKNELYADELDDSIIRKVGESSKSSLVPMTAFFGGIIAQELVKLTGKYSPLKQWFHYDILETIPTENVDRTPLNSRYDDQIRVYGREIQEKLAKVKTFMVGSGALGCELFKAFALIGLGCGAEGKVFCTDNDNIEVSNLNRQFLFRSNHVGHSKSATAGQIAKEINPALNTQTFQTYVSPDTQAVFNDAFWESLDFIVNAVDNIKARLYVDSRCVWYEKPLLESGTLGCQANSQMIVPHKTKCYNDYQDQEEESIPMCTMRNFPNLIDHCIEWGRDSFNTNFVTRTQDAISFIANPEAFLENQLKNTTTSGALETLVGIKQVLSLKKNPSFANCLQAARDLFDTYFDHAIRDLLAKYPADCKDTHGELFWSGPKRCPTSHPFNPEESTHLLFAKSCANLIAFNLGISQVREDQVIKQIVVAQTSKPYIKKDIIVETPEEVKAREEAKLPPPKMAGMDDEKEIEVIMSELKTLVASSDMNGLQAAEFEKDDDSNFHIDFIHATAQSRAYNYRITQCDIGKTKMIAGKIIPAIATTTAMITGAVAAEIFKFVQGRHEIADFKNFFVNLALPLFRVTEPDVVNKAKDKPADDYMGTGPVIAVPQGWTIYDKIIVKGPLTIQQLVDKVKADLGVEVQMLGSGKANIYNAYSKPHKERQSKTVEDVYVTVTKEPLTTVHDYLVLTINGENADGNEVDMPPIKYYFK